MFFKVKVVGIACSNQSGTIMVSLIRVVNGQ